MIFIVDYCCMSVNYGCLKQLNDFLVVMFFFLDNCGIEMDYKCFFWIGGNDIEMEGGYVWDYLYIDLNFINWFLQEFNEVNLDSVFLRDCIDIKRFGFWVD